MAAAAAAAALLSIVRPIIYSQLKVHRVSAAKTAARTAEGGREGGKDAIPRALHGVPNKVGRIFTSRHMVIIDWGWRLRKRLKFFPALHWS